MAKIYKSETTCEFCGKPILWYILIGMNSGEPLFYAGSEIFPYRPSDILQRDDNIYLLSIRCNKCGKANAFSHMISDK